MSENGDLPLESIEDAILRMRSSISSFLSEGTSHPLEGSWREDLPNDSYESIAAIDGGSGKWPINQGQVIFVTSSSLFERGRFNRRARKYQVGVLDDLWNNERISICRETMEVKMALRAVESSDPEVVLLDGSLESLVGDETRTPFGARYGFQHLRRLFPLEEIVSKLSAEGIDLKSGLISLTLSFDNSEAVDRIVEEYYKSKLRRAPDRDELLRARIFLERYETLVSLNELLSKSRRLVAVSKRSGSRLYFRFKVPDMEVVRRSYRFKAGYLEPKRVELKFPDYYRTELSRSYPLTVTYAKLERNASPLRIEVLGEHDDSFLSKVLGSLSGSSVMGYPYHLRLAHEMARIGRKEMVHLLRNLHLIDRVSGREILGE